jgi:mannose-6-phosphate isomerase-like protein (cupin superfamily)
VSATTISIAAAPKKEMSNDRGVNHLLVDETVGLGNLFIQVQEFKPGAAFGKYHYHERSDNVFMVLEGTLKAVVDGQTHLLGAGDLLFIPAGAPHKATNGGSVVVRALEIYAPPAGSDSHPAPEPEA